MTRHFIRLIILVIYTLFMMSVAVKSLTDGLSADNFFFIPLSIMALTILVDSITQLYTNSQNEENPYRTYPAETIIKWTWISTYYHIGAIVIYVMTAVFILYFNFSIFWPLTILLAIILSILTIWREYKRRQYVKTRIYE
ncbi:hypothetical protein ERX27_04545 [Macrococcus brunensis]|uniref:Uncharacterized protein n=1 Tax=Macrococcus brunensis TaxID=198483 RepID=A0A4R6BEC9_9STAP|nr:hypothetical protein [Macrococcus brunensis]TDL98171.1 hypothetical protein ERX27_04545 [Macrococcus brunensis]ULG73492.1 hypothetical protein MGG13_07180 [Macrococcus brunensis]